MAGDLSRRDFFLHGFLYGGSAWLAVSTPWPRALADAESPAAREALNEIEWLTLEAVTSRIIPSDDGPGALEAGCVAFIDRALAHEDAAMRPIYEAGLAGLEAASRLRFAKGFVELSAAERDEVLASLESGGADGWPTGAVSPQQFFESVRLHTLYGLLSDPSYGGNRDYIGWKLAGYPGSGHHGGGHTPDQMIGTEKIVPVWEKVRA